MAMTQLANSGKWINIAVTVHRNQGSISHTLFQPSFDFTTRLGVFLWQTQGEKMTEINKKTILRKPWSIVTNPTHYTCKNTECGYKGSYHEFPYFKFSTILCCPKCESMELEPSREERAEETQIRSGFPVSLKEGKGKNK